MGNPVSSAAYVEDVNSVCPVHRCRNIPVTDWRDTLGLGCYHRRFDQGMASDIHTFNVQYLEAEDVWDPVI